MSIEAMNQTQGEEHMKTFMPFKPAWPTIKPSQPKEKKERRLDDAFEAWAKRENINLNNFPVLCKRK